MYRLWLSSGGYVMKAPHHCHYRKMTTLQTMTRRDFIITATAAGVTLLTSCGQRQPVTTPQVNPTAELSGDHTSESYIACCGTSYCLDCPEYESTCAGCLAGPGEKVSTTAAECAVRTCSQEKKLPNCAYCDAYPCSTLEELYAKYGGMAAARLALDEIQQSLQ
jgi:hypothetical protein